MEKELIAANHLLKVKKKGFRNSDLALALGVSRQRCTVVLRRFVQMGALEPVGSGPARRYKEGPASPFRASPQGLLVGAEAYSVWQHLATALPWFVYIHLGENGATKLRTRSNVRYFLAPLQWADTSPCVVMDLQGIRSITWPAADELVNGQFVALRARALINASDDVQQVLEAAKTLSARRLASQSDSIRLPDPDAPRFELAAEERELLADFERSRALAPPRWRAP